MTEMNEQSVLEQNVEKKVDGIAVTSDSGRGAIQISNNVIGMIVKKYALEVPGVLRFPQQGALEGLFDVLSKRPVNRNVDLDLQSDCVAITLSLVLQFGVKIPEVCQMVQDMVKGKVEELTGYPVSTVNINVVDMDDPEEKPAPQGKEAEGAEGVPEA